MDNMIKLNKGETLDIRMDKDSILSDGYGIAPKLILRDKNIHIYSKAIYVYLASFAGNKGYCHPKMETIYKELGISKNSFIKYMEVLKENGFITVIRVKDEKNMFSNNVYEIAMSKSKIESNKIRYKNKKSPTENKDSESDSYKKNLSNSNNVKDSISQIDEYIQVLKLNGFTEEEIYSMQNDKIKQAAETLIKIMKRSQK